MKCIDPILCYTSQNGKRHFRHFSLANKIFIQHLHKQVYNCGQCLFCRKKRAYELACKCVLHSSLYSDNCFLTLTYDEKKDGYHNEFEYSDIQKFKKRLRAYCKRNLSRSIEVFNVHEYGKNGKKHWHLIVFNYDPNDKVLFKTSNSIPIYTSKTLERLWPHGFSTVGNVSEASAMYQAQYCEKDFKNGNRKTEKQSHSKHSGIGKPYFLKHYKQILTLGYIPINGKKLPLPRSFARIAHKHWCHFYDQSYFHDTIARKAWYRPFKNNDANKEMADLFAQYQEIKAEKIKELEENWSQVINEYLSSNREPDFIKSGSNSLYDLQNKNKLERF